MCNGKKISKAFCCWNFSRSYCHLAWTEGTQQLVPSLKKKKKNRFLWNKKEGSFPFFWVTQRKKQLSFVAERLLHIWSITMARQFQQEEQQHSIWPAFDVKTSRHARAYLQVLKRRKVLYQHSFPSGEFSLWRKNKKQSAFPLLIPV